MDPHSQAKTSLGVVALVRTLLTGWESVTWGRRFGCEFLHRFYDSSYGGSYGVQTGVQTAFSMPIKLAAQRATAVGEIESRLRDRLSAGRGIG